MARALAFLHVECESPVMHGDLKPSNVLLDDDFMSVGVLVLVILSGRRLLHVLSSPTKPEKANLVSWCRQLARAGNVLDLIDERLEGAYDKSTRTRPRSACSSRSCACNGQQIAI
ncbi:putative protein kinase superfamily protein [Hordeum vulgare]|nr:putative protein kinase superfamily protein [Hordeum vulgare]KAI4991331.1 hypothetical protein ZWY2020_039702 [Hordeum vulgare]